MEEDTSKIRYPTGTVFIQGPSIVLPIWRCIMFNGSYLRVCRILWFMKKIWFSFLTLGGPCHGARDWCLGRVPNHRYQWQELSVGAYFELSFIGCGFLIHLSNRSDSLDSEPHGRRYVKNMIYNRNRLYSRAIHYPASMEMHYVQWFLLKSMYEITDCAKK